MSAPKSADSAAPPSAAWSLIVAALAALDAADNACPVNSTGRSYERCPKCWATADQNCGPNVSALVGLEMAARAALKASA